MKPHILFVEDDQRIVEVYLDVLADAYLDVTHSEDVANGLALVAAGAIDLVIMDILLGNSAYAGKPVDGKDYALLLKSDPRTCAVPVLLWSALAMPGDGPRFCQQSHADDYLAKPLWSPKELPIKIYHMLGRPVPEELLQP